MSKDKDAKTCKKKTSFFGDRGSRQTVRDEMVKDGFDSMEIARIMQDERMLKDKKHCKESGVSVASFRA